MNGIDNTIYKSPLRNLTKDNLLKLKNFMNLEEYLEHNFKNDDISLYFLFYEMLKKMNIIYMLYQIMINLYFHI